MESQTQAASCLLASPLGTLRLWAAGGALVRLELCSQQAPPAGSEPALVPPGSEAAAPELIAAPPGPDSALQGPMAAAQQAVLAQGCCQLQQYFAGQRRHFTVALRPAGTPFYQAVWRQLLAIPYGEQRSYGRVAAALGRPGAARAVGGACHANPLPIFVPCHRVCAAAGEGGFALGLPAKRLLLRLEAAGAARCGAAAP